MIAVRGAGSLIAQELNELVPVRPISRYEDLPLDAERYLFCQGILRAKSEDEQTDHERLEGWMVNYDYIRHACDEILKVHDTARICVIGSESGFVGSYDEVYAKAKRALHYYVQTKRLRTPDQQLVCIAPGVIEDGGMCARRTDSVRVEARRQAHPQQRFLKASEVARLVHYVLCIDKGYLSGVVIRMNGGEHTKHEQICGSNDILA